MGAPFNLFCKLVLITVKISVIIHKKFYLNVILCAFVVAKEVIMSSQFNVFAWSHLHTSTIKLDKQSCCIVNRRLFLMKVNLLKDLSPSKTVTGIDENILRVTHTCGNRLCKLFSYIAFSKARLVFCSNNSGVSLLIDQISSTRFSAFKLQLILLLFNN